MKLNTVLLTSAATLMATSVAFAADLPSKKAAPSSGSVQVCKIAGKTGFTLPGSSTCIVVGGYVWAEAQLTGSGTGSLDTSGAYESFSTKLREQLDVDALTNTEMGVLSSHASFRFTQSGQSTTSGGYYQDNYATGPGSAGIDSAYVQLGGFKVGYFSSTFGMMDGSPSYEAANISPSNTVMQIGYSAALGNGVTLGLALEDVKSYGGWSSASNSSGTDYAGLNAQRMPDVVGTLDLSTAMADFHIGAVYHDIYNPDTKTDDAEYSTGEAYNTSGYAFDVGVKFKLDSIAKGDTLSLEYTYVDGAAARLSGIGGGAAVGSLAGLVGFSGAWTDIAYDNGGSSGDYITTTGNSYAASLHHVFSSSLSGNVFGGYQTIEVSGYNASATLVGANLDWQPVKNFHIQPEVWHTAIDNDYYDATETKHDGSLFTGLLRIKRDF